MLGVVIWSDNSDNKAVIWCEDQGDLAFFNGGDHAPIEILDLDAGDLVHFELQQEKHLRYAHNPQRIEQGAYEGLAEKLHSSTTSPQPNEIAASGQKRSLPADVIPFERTKVKRVGRELIAV